MRDNRPHFIKAPIVDLKLMQGYADSAFLSLDGGQVVIASS
ncbi:MAG: hypothetical protein P8I83_10725 [Paracoccaceae bacterium]|nr:hypothetical protein [Paracoccaceae bacterium]